MGINNQFEVFCNNIKIQKSNVDKIANRYKTITKLLNKEYYSTESDTAHSLYVGSYGRDTDIHTSDVDILFWLPWEKYTQYKNYLYNGQSALIQDVKNVIKKTYPSSAIRGDGQVIIIDFFDGMKFEIVPCFELSDKSFLYPDTNEGGSWKYTDPRKEIEEIRNENFYKCNKNLKRLCRMARAWKEKHSVNISGYLIDTLAYKFLKGCSYKNNSYMFYHWMIRDFFSYLKDQNIYQQYWVVPGSNKYVYRYGQSFEYKALLAFNLAVEAIENDMNNCPYTATGKWKEIFGAKFPY